MGWIIQYGYYKGNEIRKKYLKEKSLKEGTIIRWRYVSESHEKFSWI